MSNSSNKRTEKPYVQAKMVNWFHPAMLLNAAIKAIVAGTFGNYADRREVQATLHNSAEEQKEVDGLNINYSTREEIWVDFISDTGDGFNPTYSVVLCAAQDELIVSDAKGEKIKLPRGKILCCGGDQIYPTPSADLYEQKFRIPFRAANPQRENQDEHDRPHLYAIPGNHDWYDGLGNFIKIFCQGRWIGNWMTKQHRSYFALQLPYRHWIWATDVQLNADIDQPQLDYFLNLAKSDRMKSGDKIILITAEPAWVYKQLYVKDKSYDRLRFFTEVYITKDKYGLVGKKFDLLATLTGDLHHYSHYASEINSETRKDHFITAGGGGAFSHLTNNLPDKLPKLDEEINPEDTDEKTQSKKQAVRNLKLEAVFPSKKESQVLTAGNLLFPFKNFGFTLLIGSFYFLIAWLSQSLLHMLKENFSLEDAVLNLHRFRQYLELKKLLLEAPPVIIISLIFFFGILLFTDTKTGRKGVMFVGFFHALIQIIALYGLLWLFAAINLKVLGMQSENTFQIILYIAECLFIGGFAGSFIMGIYLYLTNLLLEIHLDEASSSLGVQDFKNFLRMHISRDGLTIYPIGIKRVIKNWKTEGSGEKLRFISQPTPGKLPECRLIEDPIIVK